MLIDPAISAAFGVCLAALFAASAAHKARGFAEFAGVVRNYRLAPEGVAPALSAIVIALEAMLAAGLLYPPMRAAAGVGAAALLLAYGGAIAFNLARGRRDIDCGCTFGGSGERLTPVLVIRNAGLAVLALAVAAPQSVRALGAFDYASIALFALTSAALYVAFESLRANHARFFAAGHI
ncbi:MAG: MauE/DoxX family redox-associated membrane protein [Pseudomonadota bacterium]